MPATAALREAQVAEVARKEQQQQEEEWQEEEEEEREEERISLCLRQEYPPSDLQRHLVRCGQVLQVLPDSLSPRAGAFYSLALALALALSLSLSRARALSLPLSLSFSLSLSLFLFLFKNIKK